MRAYRARAAVAAAALLFPFSCAVLVHRFAPYPSADSARASEEAFADGLEEREFVPPMMGPGRWTGPGASFEFENLPEGPLEVEVRVRNHQNTVRVLLERERVGLIEEGTRGADFSTRLGEGDDELRVDLVVKPFLARGGRRLGTFLDRVTVVHARTLLPPFSLLAAFALPALAVVLSALVAGVSFPAALALSAACSLAQAALLLPHGVVRSDYTFEMALLLTVGAGIAGALSRRRPWQFAALLTAFVVQCVAGLHPLVIGLDASFHGHNLAEVMAGDYFLESETQHKPPFRFPYGVSLYVLLLPLSRSGLALPDVVLLGAALAGLAASAATFFLMVRVGARPWVAFATVAFLQLAPWSFDVYSNGNYSNVFAQAGVVAFVAWWAAGKPLSWAAGAAAFFVAALAHLSAFFFLLALGAALAVVHRKALGEERDGFIALGVGIAGAALYYAQFAPLVLEQLPRLLEGGRGGTGTRSILDSLGAQLRSALNGWGPPAIVLAWLGRPRGNEPWNRDLRALWLAGALLAVAAVTTPLEVRYVYALTFPLAVAAAMGLARLLQGAPRSRVLAAALVAAQAALAVRNIALALLYDWRA